MTNKVTMPEPVAFRWRAPIVDSDGRQCGESDWKFGTKKGGHPWWTRDNLITTNQAEAYANAMVKQALGEAAMILKANAEACHSDTRIMLRANAEAILDLLSGNSPNL